MRISQELTLKRSLLALAAVVCVLAAQPLSVAACSIPVFRYALERWKPTSYEAMIFHRGPLNAEQEKAIAALIADTSGPLNLVVTPIDLASAAPDPSSQKLWEQQKNATLPWLLIRSPDAAADAAPLYAGALDVATAKALADSPARRTIARRLLDGDSAVWVLLESGNRERDDASAKLLTERVKTLEQELRLAEFDEEQERAADEPGLLSKLPLKLRFSVMRVSRTDPAEARFADLLRYTEPELKKKASDQPLEPIVFPVFGQGRVLCGLEGKNLTAETIGDCATFLIGDCSCRVKELNPGVDLLIAGNWGSILDPNRAAEEDEPKLDIPDPVIGSGKPKRAKPPATPSGN